MWVRDHSFSKTTFSEMFSFLLPCESEITPLLRPLLFWNVCLYSSMWVRDHSFFKTTFSETVPFIHPCDGIPRLGTTKTTFSEMFLFVLPSKCTSDKGPPSFKTRPPNPHPPPKLFSSHFHINYSLNKDHPSSRPLQDFISPCQQTLDHGLSLV